MDVVAGDAHGVSVVTKIAAPLRVSVPTTEEAERDQGVLQAGWVHGLGGVDQIHALEHGGFVAVEAEGVAALF
jgi:hypothetical protein